MSCFKKWISTIINLITSPSSEGPTLVVTDICNGRCIYCLEDSTTKSKYADITDKKIQYILDEHYNEINIMGGEPLIYKNLDNVVRKVAASGVSKIHLFTNGLLLTQKRLDELYDAGVTIFHFNFPIHTAKEHEYLTGLPGNLNRQKEAIQRACKKGKNTATLIFVINSVNYKAMSDYVRYASQNFPDLFYIMFILIKVKGRAKKNTWLVPRLSDIEPEMNKALNTAKELGIACLIDGIPLCFLKNHEAYSWDITHILNGNNIYPTDRTDTEACHKCTLSDICVGARKDYVKIHGKSEFKTSSRNKDEILKIVKSGQLRLNEK